MCDVPLGNNEAPIEEAKKMVKKDGSEYIYTRLE
jgi:hypothetical protein